MTNRHAIGFALLAILAATPSTADERKPESTRTFERKVTENWSVYGIAYPNHERNDVCLAFKEWKDGSKMEIVKDMKSGEFYIWHQAMHWSRVNDDKQKSYTLRMNFYDPRGNFVDGGTIGYRLWNKNTITISGISERIFLKAFVNANRLLVIPEGDVGNSQAYFDGRSNDIALALAECVKAYGKGQAQAETQPRAPIEPPSLDVPQRASMRDSL